MADVARTVARAKMRWTLRLVVTPVVTRNDGNR